MKKYPVIQVLFVSSLLLSTACTPVVREHKNLTEELGYTEEIKNRYQADTEWWKQYNNAELNNLVDTALKNNPDYLKAALTISKELYNLNLTEADLFPTLSGNMGANSSREISTGDHFTSNFSGELGLNYEVDLYGKIRDARSAQEFEYQASIQDRESARLSLINSVVDLYFNLEYLSNSIDITRQNIRSYENIEKIVSEKFVNGKVDQLEEAQAKQSLLSEKNRLLDLETQFKSLEQSLKNILNLRPGEELNLKYGSILEQDSLGINTGVPLSVLANRPDLRASQYRLEKAFKNLEAEDKNWYPSISVGGAIASSSDKARTTFEFPYIAGNVSLNLPFLDWNRVKNNVKISEADYQIARIDFQDTLAQALNEVAYYSFAYNKLKEIYNNSEENYYNSIKITDYYAERYNNGKVEFRYLLDAINSENSLRKDLLQQKYQIINHENYIYKAMGGRY